MREIDKHEVQEMLRERTGIENLHAHLPERINELDPMRRVSANWHKDQQRYGCIVVCAYSDETVTTERIVNELVSMIEDGEYVELDARSLWMPRLSTGFRSIDPPGQQNWYENVGAPGFDEACKKNMTEELAWMQ